MTLYILLYYIILYHIICLFYFTIQALYKNSLYKKMRGWICRMEDKKLRDPGIFKAKKFRCM